MLDPQQLDHAVDHAAAYPHRGAFHLLALLKSHE